jgi:hypothetical protein
MKLMASPALNYASPRLQASSASTARSPQAHTPQADAQRLGASLHGINFLSPYLKFKLSKFLGGIAGGLVFMSPGLFGAYRDAKLAEGFSQILTSDCPASLRLIEAELKDPSLKNHPVVLKARQNLLKELEARCKLKPLP